MAKCLGKLSGDTLEDTKKANDPSKRSESQGILLGNAIKTWIHTSTLFFHEFNGLLLCTTGLFHTSWINGTTNQWSPNEMIRGSQRL